MSTLAPAPPASPLRFCLRCVGWGLATGAATGGLAGAIGAVLLLIGGDLSNLAVAAVVGGVVIGAAVAAVPSVVGALVVTAVVNRRHPRPVAPEMVRRDLTCSSASWSACSTWSR